MKKKIIKLPQTLNYKESNNIKQLLGEEIIWDFEDTTYIDSSGLGILLMIREKSPERKENKKVKLINIGSGIMPILHMAQFGSLFDMHEKN
jgi:anti-anti-sigma factor